MYILKKLTQTLSALVISFLSRFLFVLLSERSEGYLHSGSSLRLYILCLWVGTRCESRSSFSEGLFLISKKNLQLINDFIDFFLIVRVYCIYYIFDPRPNLFPPQNNCLATPMDTNYWQKIS